MKCKHAEKSILLKDSGELTPHQTGALAEHLDECTSCRAFERGLLESKTAFSPADEPNLKSLQNVLREARRNAPDRKHVKIFGLKPVLAMASSLAILLGIFLSNVSPDEVGLVFNVTETQLLDPDDQVVSVMYDGLSEDDLAFNFLMTYWDDG
jgi:predicted anti-sigma-YlaC factor YlaD